MLSGLILYLLAVATVWIFRLSYLGWFGGFLFWLVVFLPPMILLFSLPAMLSLGLQLEAPDTVSCGEEACCSLVFRNPKHVPSGRVRVRLEIMNLYTGEKADGEYQFDAVRNSVCSVPIPSEFCGTLRLRVLRWSCADFIGVFRLRRKAPPAVRCCVLPIPASPESAAAKDVLAEAQPRMKPKYGGGFAEDHELRVYRPGDLMNSVHWKLSGKTEELIVREALVPENDKTYLILQKAGQDDRGLQTLLWLSQQLNAHEIDHIIVSDDCYPVGDDAGTTAALKAVLSKPFKPPVRADLSDARRIYTVEGGEVSVC